MKIKLGFVTNSSSTSFCVWGMEFHAKDCDDNGHIPDYLPEEVLRRSYQYYLDHNKDGGFYRERYNYHIGNPIESKEVTYDFFRRKISEFDYDFTEYIVRYLDDHGLESIFSCESEFAIIGKSPFDIRDDETSKEYKESIKLLFEEVGFDKNNTYLNAIQEEVNT